MPKFSIITIVYNGESLIAGTMQSALNQTFTDYEYIIVDGASKDATLSIIQGLARTPQPPEGESVHNSPFGGWGGAVKWISERDKGLYDAMNKGLRLATGDFVLFLNAGDRLFEPTTLEKIAAAATPTTDILYGETMLVDDDRNHIGTRTALTVQKLPTKLTWQSMRFGMVVCHQAFLPARKLTPQYIEANLAADIAWVINCLKNAQNITNTHVVVSEYLMGGMSKTRHQQSLKDRYAVLETHFGKVGNILNHGFITLRAVIFKVKNWGKTTY